MDWLKTYIKGIIFKSRFLSTIYFYISLPVFTCKFTRQVSDNFQFDISDPESVQWKNRIDDVIICEDNFHIPRDENAGRLIRNKLIMHNGIKVHPLSYYGKYMLKMLMENKGVHEPQEERAFQEILKEIPENSIMMELGAYWAFYSLWFNKQIKGAVTYMIEPNPICYESGKLNFRINNFKGTFINAYIGKSPSRDSIPTYSVDTLIKKLDILHVHILHSDIQGYELDMLYGCMESITANKISYFFISTHSNDLHSQCIFFLLKYNFAILANINCSQSFSVDGLIVAKAAFVSKPEKVEISFKE
jgi:hypothetical protein